MDRSNIIKENNSSAMGKGGLRKVYLTTYCVALAQVGVWYYVFAVMESGCEKSQLVAAAGVHMLNYYFVGLLSIGIVASISGALASGMKIDSKRPLETWWRDQRSPRTHNGGPPGAVM